MYDLNVAHGGWLFFLCSVVISFVVFQSVYFMRLAWQRGHDLGMATESMKRSVLIGGTVSIVPALPVLMVLLLLLPALGPYLPWMRLSVIGSGTYESMAADLTARSFGFSGFMDPGFSTEAFVAALWVMTIGIIWGPLYTLLGTKWIHRGMVIFKRKGELLLQAALGAMLISMLTVFAAPYAVSLLGVAQKGLTAAIPMITFLVAGGSAVVLEKLSKRPSSAWLADFGFAISLVLGMGSAVVLSMAL